MICNKCGTENSDNDHFCTKCGHKLQSVRRENESEGKSSLGPVPDLHLESKFPKETLHKFIEAWVYILMLCGATGVAVWQGVYWPLYGLIPVVALVAWLRKL
jgi:hypothetical protein